MKLVALTLFAVVSVLTLELATMSVQISVGDDLFHIAAEWARTKSGWKLADKYMAPW